MIEDDGFLMIEPKKRSRKPVVDGLTKKVTAILRRAKETGAYYKGFHRCVCGAMSGNAGLTAKILGDRLSTNSLIVHYVACHRNEIPESQMRLIKVARYSSRENPTDEEIQFV